MNKYVKGSLIFAGGLIGGMVVEKARIICYLNSKKRKDFGAVYDEVIFGSRSDARETLDLLRELCDKYGHVTIADLYEIAELPNDYTNNKFGWYTVKDVEIKRVRDGYVLDLPTPVRIK